MYALQSLYAYGSGAGNGMSKSLNIRNFRDTWLEDFFELGDIAQKNTCGYSHCISQKAGYH